jgi:hypothetical protein
LLVTREILCWFWKINENLKLQREQRDSLKRLEQSVSDLAARLAPGAEPQRQAMVVRSSGHSPVGRGTRTGLIEDRPGDDYDSWVAQGRQSR